MIMGGAGGQIFQIVEEDKGDERQTLLMRAKLKKLSSEFVIFEFLNQINQNSNEEKQITVKYGYYYRVMLL
jgi:hypothetical protein